MNQIYTLYESLKGDKNFVNLISTNFSDHFTFPKEILKKEINRYIDSRKYSPDSKGNLNTRKYISKNYEKSDLLQTLRILKTYDLLKDAQLDLFEKPKGRKLKA